MHGLVSVFRGRQENSHVSFFLVLKKKKKKKKLANFPHAPLFSYILALAAAVKSPSNYRHRLAKDIEN
jgi:hypothetical protein